MRFRSAKKYLSMAIVSAMLLSTGYNSAVFAAGSEATATPTDAVFTDSEDTEQITQEETGGVKAEDDSLKEDESTKAEAEDEATETDAPEENGIFNYAVIESDIVSAPDSQFVLVDIGDTTSDIESAELKYTNSTTGTSYSADAVNIQGSGIVFDMSFSAGQTGEYVVDSISYVVEDETYEISIADTGTDLRFGVNQAVDVDPYAWIVDEEQNQAPEGDYQELKEGDFIKITLDDKDNNLNNNNSASSYKQNVVYGNGTKLLGATNHRKALTIVLDPGHGQSNGSDIGATGYGLNERDINLKIAQACRDSLSVYDNVTIYMTRNSAVSAYSLSGLSSYAKSVGADYMISFHNNASGNGSARGAMVCVANPNYNSYVYTETNKLGSAILEQLTALGLKDRGNYIRYSANGTKYPDGSAADYYSIVYNGKMNGIPQIIIEHAFIDNYEDNTTFLNSDAKLKALGQADARGIANALGLSTTNKGPVTIYKNVDYYDVYDKNYYLNANPDVKSAYGGDDALTLIHFVKFGMKERRQGNAEFNLDVYMNNYPDLVKAYGTNYAKYYLHYINYGKKEGRNAKTRIVPGTINNGTDYSAVYDYNYYVNKYPDIKKAFGNNYAAVLNHFVTYGMREGRRGNAKFDVISYKNANPDLRVAYGSDLPKYYMHYMKYGIREGRVTTGVTKLQNPITKLNGIDYSAVYNFNYFVSNNAVAKKSYSNDDVGALKYFISTGMKNGVKGNSTFDLRSYKYAHQDLRLAYGSDNARYYIHYINYGKREGRRCNGVTTLQNPVTKLNGVDYSRVYNYFYYINNNADIKKAYPDDDVAALKHFINYGMKEGRRASAAFDLKSYKYQYKDLRKAYGTNNAKYYMHYVNFGFNEKRKASGVTRMQDFETVYNNIDFKGIYDYNYYVSKYADIRKAYGEDDTAVLAHFVKYGLKENRQGKASYDREEYERLKLAATGISDGLYPIMGSTNTTVAQMVRYYRANATYPAFYKNSDAPTIEAFCQIYYDEARAEGVKPEVAFAQAMNETGFLRFGGDVSITQYNFAGLGATGGGVSGNVFPNVRTGVRAQIQHLKAYASNEGLKNACVDQRFKYVTRGTCPYVEWLGIQENPKHVGWAAAKNYGYTLKNNYILKLLLS